jgi:hypothetical protein
LNEKRLKQERQVSENDNTELKASGIHHTIFCKWKSIIVGYRVKDDNVSIRTFLQTCAVTIAEDEFKVQVFKLDRSLRRLRFR